MSLVPFQDALLNFLQWSDNFCIFENGKEKIKKKEEANGILDAIERLQIYRFYPVIMHVACR